MKQWYIDKSMEDYGEYSKGENRVAADGGPRVPK